MNQKIYFLFTDTGTILSRMIKLYTKKPLNHASIALDYQLLDVYSFGRKRPNNPFLAGFVRENIRDGFFKDADCAIFCCTITENQFQKIIWKIGEMEKNKHDYKYNLIGLIAVMMNMELDRKNAFFCSHFVATVLEESGIEINHHKPLSLVTPYDIKESSSLELVYEGKLASYFTDSNQKYFEHDMVGRVQVI
jgi:hypothetical protein